jgi:cytochrome c peroxidase
MSLANARYYENGAFFWDERAATLEAQALLPIQDPVEMGMPDLATLETKLSAISYYPALFEDAFGTSEITSDRIAKAIAQFVRSIVSYQSKFDEGVANNFDNFTNQENMGRQIFQRPGNCDSCHRTAIHISDEPHNNGLDAQTIDAGVGGVTGDPEDDATFKAPSLRNIALSAPYMHDGRFATLDEVIDHYSEGLVNSESLDGQMNFVMDGGTQMTPTEKMQLKAFLLTLTDYDFIINPDYQE